MEQLLVQYNWVELEPYFHIVKFKLVEVVKGVLTTIQLELALVTPSTSFGFMVAIANFL